MKKLLIAAQILLCLCLTGCGGGDDSSSSSSPAPIVPDAECWLPFSIVSPETGTTVNQRWGQEVKGVGVRTDADVIITSFGCWVHTDEWYIQDTVYHDPNFEVTDNCSWRTWVSLGGTNQYNDHTIRCQVEYSDGSSASAEVSGVVVQE